MELGRKPLRDLIFGEDIASRWKRHVLFWMSALCFFTLLYGSKAVGLDEDRLPTSYWLIYAESFVEALCFLPMHLIQAYTIIYFLIPRYLLKERYSSFVAGLVLVTLFVAALSPLISNFVVLPLRRSMGIILPYNSFYFGLMSGLRGSSTVAGFAAMIKLAKLWYFKNVYNQQLEKDKIKVELELLRSQLHPHFLFNTLNNLYGMILDNSPRSADTVLKLSEMLRYILYESRKEKVPLSHELNFIFNYVDLEKMRYDNKLQLTTDVSGDIDSTLVVPAIFLPFIENAFKYGVNQSIDQAWFKLKLKVQGDELSFKLVNSKIPESETINHGGLGLENVRKRLELLYPGRHSLQMDDYKEIFVVKLSLKIDVTEKEEKLESVYTKTKVSVSR